VRIGNLCHSKPIIFIRGMEKGGEKKRICPSFPEPHHAHMCPRKGALLTCRPKHKNKIPVSI